MAAESRRLAVCAQLVACLILFPTLIKTAVAAGWDPWTPEPLAPASRPGVAAAVPQRANAWGPPDSVETGDKAHPPAFQTMTPSGDASLSYNLSSVPPAGVPLLAAANKNQHKTPLGSLSSQLLTLSDLPGETETEQMDMRVGVEQGPWATQKKAKGNLLQVFLNFFRKPHLFKIIVLVAVMFVTFFLVGIFARIAQVIFGIFLALKVLQLFEEDEGDLLGAANGDTFRKDHAAPQTGLHQAGAQLPYAYSAGSSMD
ncbi:hypothetical protein, conserved [Eimeria necatrix]|uniref:Uncharacterized protein n=1 Tax=Eimeria necatrix TaxID=51315 RepID=U6MTI7_9EIME|nr:hypothetical protein, conserved [Eimeria necatrix]CDJ66403.1 hypothetical protein, conserved [Eimeria necatrix]